MARIWAALRPYWRGIRWPERNDRERRPHSRQEEPIIGNARGSRRSHSRPDFGTDPWADHWAGLWHRLRTDWWAPGYVGIRRPRCYPTVRPPSYPMRHRAIALELCPLSRLCRRAGPVAQSGPWLHLYPPANAGAFCIKVARSCRTPSMGRLVCCLCLAFPGVQSTSSHIGTLPGHTGHRPGPRRGDDAYPQHPGLATGMRGRCRAVACRA